MPLFSYSARNQEDSTVRGTIDAVSLEAAKSALEEMNLIPEEIHEATMSEKNETKDITKEKPLEVAQKRLEKEMQSDTIETEPIQDTQAKEESEAFTLPKAGRRGKDAILYFPIIDTFRLYAGWLITGYFVAYFLGIYQLTKPLPFEIPYVLAFLYSSLILSFALAAFLFLLATGIQRRINGGMLSRFVLTLVAIGVFVVYRINV